MTRSGEKVDLGVDTSMCPCLCAGAYASYGNKWSHVTRSGEIVELTWGVGAFGGVMVRERGGKQEEKSRVRVRVRVSS